MFQITLKINGMRCGMCETHVNDAVRKSAAVKKVKSSHARGETVILTENEEDMSAIRAAIEKEGYRVLSAESVPYEKKGFFSFLKK